MRLFRITLSVLTVLFTLPAAAGSNQAASPPALDTRLTVTHLPSVVRPELKHEPGVAWHYWTFRTEVHNGFDEPVRVVEFTTEVLRDGTWARTRQAPFGSDDFGQWYTAADSAPGGWIAPGATAADDHNWFRNTRQTTGRSRWVYVVENRAGRRFQAHAEAQYAPYDPGTADWSTAGDRELVPLTIHWSAADQPLPTGSQVRVERLVQGYAPLAVYPDTADCRLAAPGIYRLEVFVPGAQPVTLLLAAEPGDGDLAVTLPALALDAPPVPKYVLGTFDPDHAWQQDLVRIARLMDRYGADYVAAATDYETRHGTVDGFVFDSGAHDTEFAAWRAAPQPAVARFASYASAIMLPDIPARIAAAIGERLPADSPWWAANPPAAARVGTRLALLLDNDYLARMALDNPDHQVRGEATAQRGYAADRNGDQELVAACYALLTTEYTDVRNAAYAAKTIDPQRRIRPGRRLPAFSVPGLDGAPAITDTTGQGQIRLLHFWASWCGPCKAEMGHIHSLHDEFNSAGLRILSFSFDTEPEDATAYREGRWALPWSHAFVEGGFQAAAAESLGVQGIPRLILVDGDGVILAVDGALRGAGMRDAVAGFLGVDAAATPPGAATSH